MFIHRITVAALALLALFFSSCSSGPSGPSVDFSDQVIVAFGDSITAGVGDDSYPRGPSGYPIRLERMLQASFPNAIVLNRGVPGERTPAGARRINSVLARDNPDYVLILEGVNNIRDSGTSWVPGIVTDLESMVLAVKAAGATPLIASLTPTFGIHDFQMATIELVNPIIADIAARERIAFVDLFTTFSGHAAPKTLYIEDGLHPNSSGYDLMAQAWFDGLLGKL